MLKVNEKSYKFFSFLMAFIDIILFCIFKEKKQFGEAKKLIESTMKSIGDFGNIKVVRYGNTATVNVGDEKICNNIKDFLGFLGAVTNEHIELNNEFEKNRGELEKAGVQANSLNELINNLKDESQKLQKARNESIKQRTQDLLEYNAKEEKQQSKAPRTSAGLSVTDIYNVYSLAASMMASANDGCG